MHHRLDQKYLQNVLINQFVPPTFCPCFVFTGINFWDMLHHVCDVTYEENMCGPIKARKCRSTNWLMDYMTIHILLYIWRRKGNQAMIFGQLIKSSMRSIFLQKSCRKWGNGTSSRLPFVFYKSLLYSKSNGQHLRFNIVM